jgi:prolyl oligopeptidase
VLYSRFPAKGEGPDFLSGADGHAVWFHRLGTPQSADRLVYADPDHPSYLHSAQVTSDGRYAVIVSKFADSRNEVRVIDLKARGGRGWAPRTLVSGLADEWRLVDATGTSLWFVTNHRAPRFRLVRIDLSRLKPRWTEVVAEQPNALEAGAIVADLSGKPLRSIALKGIGTAAGFGGKPGDPETFYSFSSFNQPQAIFRLDLPTGRSTVFARPKIDFDPADYVIEQRFYRSKDGTQIPLFVVRSRVAAAAGRAVPTLLYGYGGFDISMTPGFSATRMAWLQSGGAFALANLRGGGEYGAEWHDGGRLTNKQNVFDDFIAAGEYLIAQGIAPRNGLAIQGGSNGGLLVGAVLNQRPDLFAAANPDVGVMDMLRFDRFTAGRYWLDDYGDPEREADWRVLRAYSPYHNIRKAAYPAVLVTTADTDDRVVPAHSFKYAAALQAAPLGDKPRLIRIESRAGHGSGKPADKVVESGADVLAFLAYWSGLDIAS